MLLLPRHLYMYTLAADHTVHLCNPICQTLDQAHYIQKYANVIEDCPQNSMHDISHCSLCVNIIVMRIVLRQINHNNIIYFFIEMDTPPKQTTLKGVPTADPIFSFWIFLVPVPAFVYVRK